MVPRTLAGASPSRKTGEGARPTTERPGLGGAPPSTAAGTYPPPDRGVPLSLSLEPCAAPMPRAGAESPAEPRSALAPERTPARRRSPFLALPRPAAAPAPAGDSERSERSRVVDERPLDKNTSNVSGPGAQSPRVAQRSGGDPALSPSPSRSDNRRRRYDLREALRGVTTLGRVGKCGRCRIRGAVVIRAGIGGAHFTPIVNKPEVGIFGMGRGGLKPVVVGKEVQVRLMMPIAISYDHRLIDGGTAARFTVDLSAAFAAFTEADAKL